MNTDRFRTPVWYRTRLLVAATLVIAAGGALVGAGWTLQAKERVSPEVGTEVRDHAARDLDGADRTVPAAAEVAGAASSREPTADLEPVRRFRSSRGHTPSPEPASLRVPAIGVDSSLVTLGVEPDGSVEVPADWQDAGWFGEGAHPGQAGPAVILGHVDSKAGPAVFYRLHELEPGDEIIVERVDGSTVGFVVDRVERHDKDDLPTRAVYYPTLEPALRLITCGGVFDAQQGSYSENIVVFAVPTPSATTSPHSPE